MQNPANLANGVVMIGLLVAGAGMSAYVFVTPELRAAVVKPLAPYQYVDGKITATIESTYEDELPLRPPSSAALNALTFTLFGEGRKGVVIGKAGWLFSAEEYDWTPDSAAHLKQNLSYVAEVAAALKARGIALEIALLPEKADIYADHLTKPRPLAHEGKYERVRDALAATGATVPDLRESLEAASLTQTVFFPTDTHWSVAGAASSPGLSPLPSRPATPCRRRASTCKSNPPCRTKATSKASSNLAPSAPCFHRPKRPSPPSSPTPRAVRSMTSSATARAPATR